MREIAAKNLNLNTLIMRKIIFLILPALILLSAKTDEDPKTYLKRFFSVIKSGNKKNFRQLFMTEKEFVVVIDNASWSPEKKESVKKRGTQALFDKMAEDNFIRIAEKSKEYHFDWSKAVIDSAVFKENTKELPDLRYYIYVSSGKVHAYLFGDKCLKTASGRKLAGGIGFLNIP
jgi:hypothetical protein